MGFIVLLDNQKSWTIEIELFQKFLKEKYLNYSLSKIDNIERPYSYEWKIENPLIQGFLHKDGDSIHIDGQFDNCLRFAIDVRKIIPHEYRILFFDSSYNHQAVIEIETTMDDLKNIFC